MTPAAHVISKFSGTRKLAAALSVPPSTVQSWKDKGLIPAKHQQPILDVAKARGIALGPSDFFDQSMAAE